MKLHTIMIFVLGFVSALLVYNALTVSEALYKFSDVGDIELEVKGGAGVLTINEVGTFEVEISADELVWERTIITNATTAGFPCELQGIDFDNLTDAIMVIEWMETGKFQVVEL